MKQASRRQSHQKYRKIVKKNRALVYECLPKLNMHPVLAKGGIGPRLLDGDYIYFVHNENQVEMQMKLSVKRLYKEKEIIKMAKKSLLLAIADEFIEL